MELREDIALQLLQINAIKLSPQNPFTWASGIKSPIYCDNRIVLSHPDVRKLVIKSFSELAATYENIDAISGVATAGIAHGALLAQDLDLPFSYVRSKPKGHGRQNMIEGLVAKGQRVLVIEDLISTGGSSLVAVDTLREAGAEVAGVLAIFQYNFDAAAKRFAEADCAFKTLTDYRTLISAAKAKNMFSSSDINLLEQWYMNPHEWDPLSSTK